MFKHWLYKITVVGLFLVAISACRQSGHVEYAEHGGGYQYQAPLENCYSIDSVSRLEIYCLSGKMIVDIIPAELDGDASAALQRVLAEMQIQEGAYTLSDKESLVQTDIDNEPQKILMAQLTELNESDLSQNKFPYYVTASAFGTEKFYITREYLYSVKFQEEFRGVFFTVVKTFEPFKLELNK